MGNKKLASLIIPSYNGKEITVNLLESLKKTAYKNYEVIVVDNGSSDGCYEYVKRHFPYVKAVKVEVNEGYGKGVNAGISQSKGDYIIIMNNDMLINEPDWLSELVEVANSDEKIGVVGYVFMNVNDNIIQMMGYVEGGKLLLKFISIGRGKLHEDKFPRVIEVDSAPGLIKREVLEKIGLFDEKYFIQWDEVDLCCRTKKAGYKVVIASGSKIRHIGGVTTGKQPYVKIFHYHKNRIRFMLKNLNLFRKFINLPLTLGYSIFESFMYIAKGDIKASKAIINGIIWNVLNFRDYFGYKEIKLKASH